MSIHHDHSHAFNRAFILAIFLNAIFVVAQTIFAYFAHSTSLLADAMHNLGDVLGLCLSWLGQRYLKKSPTLQATYGKKKLSILAALANGLLLVFTCGIIATEAVYKFFSPVSVDTHLVIIVAGIGIFINGITAIPFGHGKHDLNIRSAFLHLVYDALISIGVVVAALLLSWTGWLWIDPLVGLLIALMIIKGTWGLCTNSLRLIMDGVPSDIVLKNVHDLLLQQEGVVGVHDLHVWALSTQENALSVHLWMPDRVLSDMERLHLSEKLRKDHHIHHVTIQVEQKSGLCADNCMSYL